MSTNQTMQGINIDGKDMLVKKNESLNAKPRFTDVSSLWGSLIKPAECPVVVM